MPSERVAWTKPSSRRHRAQSSGGFGEGHAFDKFSVVRDHPAKAALGDEFDGLGAEQSAKHAVHEGGAAAALQMAQHHQAGFLAGAFFDFRRNDRADAAEPGLAILLLAAGGDKIAARRFGAFGGDDEREMFSLSFRVPGWRRKWFRNETEFRESK